MYVRGERGGGDTRHVCYTRNVRYTRYRSVAREAAAYALVGSGRQGDAEGTGPLGGEGVGLRLALLHRGEVALP